MKQEPPLIYNLFPLLAGPFSGWQPHLERARSLEFNWIFINPVSYPGFSGSLYSVKDYYQLNPLFVDQDSKLEPEQQLARMLEQAHEIGLKVMIDLVINHTAIDSPLTKEHPAWYKRDSKGKIKNPGFWEGDKLVTVWGDLADIDNEDSTERDRLWDYWLKLVYYYLDLGFDGFRCDAAYKVPTELWNLLISNARERSPQAAFFAESLGCTINEVIELAEAGFDYVFNSSKYWDFVEPWCLSQYEESRSFSPSVSFPESHDTPRLMKELNFNLDAVRQRYAFAALFSTGVMIPSGFEFGFRKKLQVVRTRPTDWEETRLDLTDFITQINRFKLSQPIFCAEHPTYRFDLHVGTGEVTGVVKVLEKSGSSALMLINRNPNNEQPVVIDNIGACIPGRSKMTLFDSAASLETEEVPEGHFERSMPPAGLWVILRD
jgi:starch synthase (maltosyl-transferring)